VRPLWRSLLSALLVGIVFFVSGGVYADASPRLAQIRDRGHLSCGVMPRVAGFATVDSKGRYSGFEIDICRAISAAIFGVPNNVTFVTAESVGEFKRRGEIDIVARRLTWTLRREADNDLLFGPIIFYDGAGFLVPAALGVDRPQDLSGRPICVHGGSEALAALVTYYQSARLQLVHRPFDSIAAAAAGFFAGECAALAADISELGAVRAERPAQRDNFLVLPQMISKEPLALLMRQADEQLFLVVRWTIFALIEAEELDVSSSNVDDRFSSGDLQVRWLLGPETGNSLGLDERWVANVIRSVGNYGEIFSRHLGADSSIKLERGLNRLWTSGGLMYAPPVR